MKNPVIGLTPCPDLNEDQIWIRHGYMDRIARLGGLPVLLPPTGDAELLAAMARMCDGFLFTGGSDVSPSLYGAEPAPELGATNPFRDEFEVRLLQAVLPTRKPILGICRGMQFLNAALGGTLHQDLPTCKPGPIAHSMAAPYDRAAHSVIIAPGTPLHKLLGADEIAVNSCHHQAVDRLAPCFVSMAAAPDGVQEACYAPDHPFFWAVQWHPEKMAPEDEPSRKLFQAFLAAAKGDI